MIVLIVEIMFKFLKKKYRNECLFQVRTIPRTKCHRSDCRWLLWVTRIMRSGTRISRAMILNNLSISQFSMCKKIWSSDQWRGPMIVSQQSSRTRCAEDQATTIPVVTLEVMAVDNRYSFEFPLPFSSSWHSFSPATHPTGLYDTAILDTP